MTSPLPFPSRRPGLLRNSLSPANLILLYHRVGERGDDPLNLMVSPENFRQHLAVLRKLGLPVSLGDLVTGTRTAAGMVAITFDDGYLDNLEVAKPLLEEFDIPATIYICTRPLRERHIFYWDALASVLLDQQGLPSELRLELDEISHEWQFGTNPIERIAAYVEISGLFDRMGWRERDQLAAHILEWSGQEHGDGRSIMMNAAEIRAIRRGGLIDIGAHTVNHPWLPNLRPDEQYREMLDCRLELEEILGESVTSMAYPYGAYSAETKEAAQSAGFTHACAVQPAFEEIDHFALPRFYVCDWSGEEFEWRIRRASFGVRGQGGLRNVIKWGAPPWVSPRWLVRTATAGIPWRRKGLAPEERRAQQNNPKSI